MCSDKERGLFLSHLYNVRIDGRNMNSCCSSLNVSKHNEGSLSAANLPGKTVWQIEKHNPCTYMSVLKRAWNTSSKICRNRTVFCGLINWLSQLNIDWESGWNSFDVEGYSLKELRMWHLFSCSISATSEHHYKSGEDQWLKEASILDWLQASQYTFFLMYKELPTVFFT